MSEAPDIETEQERELRRRFGAGNDKLNLDDSSASKHDNLSPADSENEQRLGSDTADSDHVRKNFIDFFRLLLEVWLKIGLREGNKRNYV